MTDHVHNTQTQIIDISFAVSPRTPEWPGDTPFSCGWGWDMAKGASVNVSSITMSPHVGTHADAPLHVRPDTPGAEALPLHAFHGDVTVIDVSDCTGAIEFDLVRDRVARLLPEPKRSKRLLVDGIPERIVLKTGRTIGSGNFPESWPALSPDCAHELVAMGLWLLGVDCPSVDDRESKTLDVHHALFDGGAYVLENLDLRAVEPGRYRLMAFPTKFEQLDAAPVRAVLLPYTPPPQTIS